MAALDDNLSDDIMADIINAVTNVDVDACVRIFVVNRCVSTHVAGLWIYINHRQE